LAGCKTNKTKRSFKKRSENRGNFQPFLNPATSIQYRLCRRKPPPVSPASMAACRTCSRLSVPHRRHISITSIAGCSQNTSHTDKATTKNISDQSPCIVCLSYGGDQGSTCTSGRGGGMRWEEDGGGGRRGRQRPQLQRARVGRAARGDGRGSRARRRPRQAVGVLRRQLRQPRCRP
jgi:hypothetical protein